MAKRKTRGSSGNNKKKPDQKKKKEGTPKGRGKSLYNFNRDGQPFELEPAKVGKYGGFSNLGTGGDLANPDLISDFYFGKKTTKKGSMKSAAYRTKNKHVGDFRDGEILNSDDEYEREKRALPLRKRPLLFVKASEVYDPSKDLIDSLRKINNAENNYKGTINDAAPPVIETTNTDLLDEPVDVELVRDNIEADEVMEEAPVEIGFEDQADSEEEIADYDEEYGKHNEDHGSESEGYESGEDIYNYDEDVLENGDASNEGDDKDFFYIDEEGENVDMDTVQVVVTTETPKTFKNSFNTEFNPVLTIGKVELNLAHNEETDEVYSIPIRKRVAKEELTTSAIPGSELAETFTDLDIKDPIVQQIKEEIANIEADENDEDAAKDPEFGMLDCDYVANTEDIEVNNIRLGGNTQSYNVKCYKFFGNYDFHWCDEEFFVDVIDEIGLPLERHDAYLKYVYKQLVPEEDERDNSNYDHLYMTDSDPDDDDEFDVNKEFGDYHLEREEVGESLTSDQFEGLDDMVLFASKYKNTRNQDFFETQTVQTVGTGKKRKLVLNGDLDEETKQLLQDNYKLRLETKASKRTNKMEFIDEQNKNSTDLLLKYPYGFHIKNMKEEFELFNIDITRQRLSFPPLDPHGNKTLEKMGKHYNLKINKRTSKSYKYITCEKTKRTVKKGPNYQLIDQLIKQRPVFMRIDRKLPANMCIKSNDSIDSGNLRSQYRVQDGEVVGGNTLAIDASNIGHQMLRKLGWNNGEGLGKVGQQGILEPLQVLVKKSKKGVGHQNPPRELVL